MILSTKPFAIFKPRIISGICWLAMGKTVKQVDDKFATTQAITAYTTKAEATAKAATNVSKL